MNRYVWLAGRVLLASIFLIGATYKAAHWGDTTTMLGDSGFPAPALLLLTVLIVEFAGGAALVLGFRARPVAWFLAGYLFLVTLVLYHDWSNALNVIFSVANVALLGGLLLIAATPEPVPSVDAFLIKRQETKEAEEALGGAVSAAQARP